jgi:hypothetical protein
MATADEELVIRVIERSSRNVRLGAVGGEEPSERSSGAALLKAG